MPTTRNLTVGVVILLCLLGNSNLSQAQDNPDVSFIGDLRALVSDDRTTDPDQYGKLQLQFHELEIAASGYLNPFARADVTLAIHGTETLEIEEAYLTLLRGLPWNVQLKAGQYLADFGKLNTQHPHQWSWIQRPLMHTELFGDDGLKDVGLNLSSLIPAGDAALGFSVNLLKTGALGGHHHHHEGEETTDDEEHAVALALAGRFCAFLPLSEITALEIGVSALRAEADAEEHHFADLAAFDAKLKWKPDQYRSLTLLAEGLIHRREVDDAELGSFEVESYGAFTAVDWQFKRRFNAGGCYDYTQCAEHEGEFRYGYGAFFGFSLAEETTRFSLLLRRDDGSEFNEPFHSVLLQALWSLGPHKPHTF